MSLRRSFHLTRREWCHLGLGVAASASLTPFAMASPVAPEAVVGQGDFRYRRVAGWNPLVGVKVNNRPGYLSVLDKDFKILSNIGGSAPVYDDKGVLQPIVADGNFRHPHDVAIGPDGALYVGQFDSGDQPLLKLENVA